MSDMAAVGTGAAPAPVRPGEVRHQSGAAKLQDAAVVDAKKTNPAKVVTKADTSNADNNLGRVVDMKA